MIYLNLLLVIIIIVSIHEYGHYLSARLFGADVTDFSIGFGKPIYQYTDKNNTKWKISPIPLGGYVKIKGLDTVFQKNINIEEGSFQSLKLYQKIIILLAGSVFNIISAWIVILFFLFFSGIPLLTPKIAEILENSPAYHAGLKSNDLIVSINDTKISNFNEVVIIVKNNNKIKIDFIRDNQLLSTSLESIFNKELNRNTIGIIVSSDNVKFIKYDIFTSLKQSILSISNFYYLNLSHLKESYNENNLSKDLAGPIGIVKNAHNLKLDTLNGFINIFIAFSLIISLFNLFPIPLLDGGHILYFTISRIFSNTLPEFVTKIYLTIGITIISFIFIYVTFNDVFYK